MLNSLFALSRHGDNANSVHPGYTRSNVIIVIIQFDRRKSNFIWMRKEITVGQEIKIDGPTVHLSPRLAFVQK